MPQRSVFTRSASYGAFSTEEQAKIDALSADLRALFRTPELASFDPADLQSQEYIDWFAENAPSLSGPGKHIVGLGGPAYAAIFDMISDTETVINTAPGNPPILTERVVHSPKPGVDLGTWTWLRGAQEVNAAEGFQGQFIQEYTKIQNALRYGDRPEAELIDIAQEASNAIANAVLLDISRNNNLPDFEGIGVGDAGAVALTAFDDEPTPAGDFAPWAGTLLLPALGDIADDFFESWLLPDDIRNPISGRIEGGSPNDASYTFKNVPGSYDLISVIHAGAAAGWVAGGPISGNVDETFRSIWGSTALDENIVLDFDQSNLISATNDWFQRYYGLAELGSLNPGLATVFDSPSTVFDNFSALGQDANYRVGTLGDDAGDSALFIELDGRVLNAGWGNDEVLASNAIGGTSIIDGDRGVDSLRFSDDAIFSVSLSLVRPDTSLGETRYGSHFQVSSGVTDSAPGDRAFLYSFEDLSLTVESDIVFLPFVPTSEDVEDGASVRIDARKHGASFSQTVDGEEVEFDGDVLVLGSREELGSDSVAGSTDERRDFDVNLQDLLLRGIGGSVTVEGFEHVVGSSGIDGIFGSEEANLIIGRGNGDNLAGGEGSDTVDGGSDADWLFDNGTLFSVENGVAAVVTEGTELLAYDPDGDDKLIGGAGSDILVSSGGRDTLAGGTGNDLYLATSEVLNNENPDDHVTVIFSDEEQSQAVADEGAVHLGHDYILADAADVVVFEGFQTADVTVTFEYMSTLFDTVVSNFNPLFGWTYDPFAVTSEIYQVVGTALMTLADGSSLTVEGVTGAYSVSDNPSMIQGSAFVAAPFQAVFDDGVFDWTEALRSSSDPTMLAASTELGEEAFVALTALQEEREVPTDTIEIGDDVEFMQGTRASEVFVGDDRNNTAFGGGGADVFIADLGDDAYHGGAGYDRVSYAERATGVRLGDTAFGAAPDLWGTDTYTNIEEIEGSDHDDYIRIVDTLMNLDGGAGNDTLIVSNDPDGSDPDYEGVIVEGGAGDDSIRGSYGSDTILGGDGADTIEGYQFLDGFDSVEGGAGDDLYIAAGRFQNFSSPTITGIDDPNAVIGIDYETFDGGEGEDELALSYRQLGRADVDPNIQGVHVNVENGTVTGLSGLAYTLFSNVENITTSGGHDTIFGDEGDNRLSGMFGDDVILGGAGNDILHAGDGDDTVFGGDGDDTLLIRTNMSDVTFSFENGVIVATVGDGVGRFSSAAVTAAQIDLFGFADEGQLLPQNDGQRYLDMDTGMIRIHEDVEIITFLDGSVSFADAASGVVTEVLPVDDFVSVEEGQTLTLTPTSNDIVPGAWTVDLTSIRYVDEDVNDTVGTGLTEVGETLRLASGATVSVTDAGEIVFDQAGAYAALGDQGFATEEIMYDVVGDDGVARSARVSITIDGSSAESDLSNRAVVFETDTDRAVVKTVSDFDIKRSVVVIDGQLIDPDASYNDIEIVEIVGDTYIVKGDDAVILEDISLDAWKARDPFFRPSGTAGDDILKAPSSDPGQGRAHDLEGLDGNDVLIASEYATDLEGGDGDDALIGGAGDDYLTGGHGSDTMIAGAGDDSVYIDYGVDENLDGGDGTDFVRFDWRFVEAGVAGYTIDLAAGEYSSADGLTSGTVSNFERVFGSDAEDTIAGGAIAEEILGWDGDDVLSGGAGDDTILGNEGDDLVRGGAGDDLLISSSATYFPASYRAGNTGQDTFDGGLGIDTLDFGGEFDAVNLDLATGEIVTASGEVESVRNVEVVLTGSGNDVLFGSADGEGLYGQSGDDVLDGRAGDDTLDGGNGNDSLSGGDGNDLLIAGSGQDAIDGGAGFDRADFSSSGQNLSFDLVAGLVSYSLGGQETLVDIEAVIGGRGDDTVSGNSVANELMGGSGDDLIDGADGADTLDGGRGNDTLSGGTGADTFVVNDQIISAVFVLLDDDGIDVIRDFDPSIDILEVNGVAVDPNNPTTGMTLEQVGANVVVMTDNVHVILENVDLASWTDPSGPAGVGLVGTDGADQLDGTVGNDTTTAGLGNDTVQGLDGSDQIDGGKGGDQLYGGAGADTILGGDNNDTLEGGADDDVLEGGKGGDWIVGGAGDDVLTGNGGVDTYVFADGFGQDTITDFTKGSGELIDLSGVAGVNAVANVLIEQNGTATVLRFDTDGDGQADGANAITLEDVDPSAIDATVLVFAPAGPAGANLVGTDGADQLDGTTGNDTISAGLGNDTVQGADGADQIDGGRGGDQLFGGAGADTILGGDNNDTLEGGADDDLLEGGKGGDWIVGGAGDDVLTGDGGVDTYVFADGFGHDTITDFTRTSGELIDLTGVAGVDAMSNIIFDTSGSDTIIRFNRDLNGVADADLSITLIGAPLSTADADHFVFM